MAPHALSQAVPMQYGQEDAYAQGAYAQPGAMYPPQPAGYVDPAYAAQPTQPMYGPQPYAGDPYGQPVMGVPSKPAMSPMAYDPGYANYMYGMQSPRSPRRFVIQAAPPRRAGLFNTDSILTVLIVCGTLFLVLLAMLLIVTVVVPRLTRKHHPSHKKRHEFPMEHEEVADVEMSNLDAPQVKVADKAEDTVPKHSSDSKHGAKKGSKDPALIRNIRRAIKR